MRRLTLNNLDGMTGLAGLADRTGVDIRPTLLRVLTDLYLQKPSHSADEDQHYTELAMRLIDVVDEATRQAVASRLARHPHPPKAVMERLAQATPQSAPDDRKGSVELFGGSVELFDTGIALDDDLGIFEPVVASKSVKTEPGASAPPAARPAVDYVEQREIFFSADSAERKLILMSLEHVAEPDLPPAQETNLIRYLEQAALAGRAQEFTTLLQQGLRLSRALSRRIVADAQGEPFVVAAKALALPTDVFQRILMSLNPAIAQSVDSVFELSDLFSELPAPSALHLVAIWRAADRMEARQIVHRPVYAADIPHSPRSAAAHEPNRTVQSPPAQTGAPKRETSGG